MRKIYYFLVCSLMAFFAALSANDSSDKKNSDWPQWRGASHNGSTTITGVFSENTGLQVAWKKTLGQGYSSVSIANGRAVTMFTDSKDGDYVVAFDANSGEEVWRYRTGPAYMGKGGSHNGPSSTPLLDGDKVFALERKGKLVALDAASGKEVWSRHIVEQDQAKEPFHGFTTAPTVYGDVLIVETGGENQNAISGYNKHSGKPVWKAGEDVVNYQSPIIANLGNTDQIVCATDNYLYGINPADGSQLWEFKHIGPASSINPVQVESDQILIQTNRTSQLIKVGSYEGSYQPAEVWQSRHLKQSFNVPVYHDGYLYGYSGRFLSCVDAKNGETVWKSRPPGDGFLILVDNHLVMLTKRGTLHIAKASPESYQEKANLKIMDGLAWSPPSFANGKIYARGLDEIVSVDIVNSDAGITIVEKERKPIATDSKFGQFVKKVENASNRKAMVEEFINAQKKFPIIEGDNLAHFLYYGPVKDLVITGDLFDQGVDEPMFRVADTDLYYFTAKLEADAHIGYQFVKDYEERMTDPRNPHSVVNFAGPESEFAMPKWQRPSFLNENPSVKKGTIDSVSFKSEITQPERTIKVYLPAGYQNSSKRYPVVYVHYGRMAFEFGKTPLALDNLIAAEVIEPVICVFIYPTRRRFQEYARNEKAQYSQMVATELVPYIDQNYRTEASADKRLIMGGDEGGYTSLYTAFKYPNVFNLVAGQSSHLHSAEGQELKEMVKNSNNLPLRFYLDWGKYDYRSVTGDYHWGENNRNFVKLLKETGYSVAGGEVNEGFGWTSWRTRTDRILKTFFGKSM